MSQPHSLPIQRQCGFTLPEVLVSVALMIVLGATGFGILVQGQKTFSSTSSRANMHAGVRSAAELIAQEINQAGVLNLPTTTISAAVTAGSGRTVTLTPATSANSIFVGESLLVDTEAVTVTAVGANSFTATFVNNHSSSAPVSVKGVFLQGIMNSSNSTTLILIGDILGDGTLVQVQYTCDTTSGVLTRSVTPVTPTASAINPADTLVDNLIANPGGTACFTYAQTTSGGTPYNSGVGLTLSVQTPYKDPYTKTNIQMTKTFLNLTARNVLAGIDMAANSMGSQNQTPPSSLPLH